MKKLERKLLPHWRLEYATSNEFESVVKNSATFYVLLAMKGELVGQIQALNCPKGRL